ncbi:hypothetical protein WJX73_007110 [Symbiochloris irregularis]|uniref:BZIP domain-containing protein n=1 Tax=Symbiochloris irregularis TaxID=706552 RepID=A0AAW1PIS0_9CHLO
MGAWSIAACTGSPSINSATPTRSLYSSGSQAGLCTAAGSALDYIWPLDVSDGMDLVPNLDDSYPPSPEDDLLLREGSFDLLTANPKPQAGRSSPPCGESPFSASPNFTTLGSTPPQDAGSGAALDAGKPRDGLREKNKLAQRKYRAKRKEQATASRKQMEELTCRLNELTMHNSELLRRQRLMASVVNTQEEHIQALAWNPVVRGVEADIILEELSRLMSKVEGRTVPAEEARTWTIQQWVTSHFQSYIGRLSELYPEAKANSNSAAASQLVELVTMRREAELRSSMFSSLYWAIWAWNVHNTPQTPANDPARTSDYTILAGLDLTQEQTEDILSARSRLLYRLGQVAQHRMAALSALGLEMLNQPDKAALLQCQAGQDLHAALEEERDVVHTFLYRVTEEILTPLQEAYLDTQLHPWFPDVWSLCNCLAASHGLPPAPEFPELEQGPAEFLPAAAPYAILKRPVAAFGIGLRLKRVVLEWHYLSTRRVSPISGLVYELPRVECLSSMTLYEAQVGTYRRHWKKDDNVSINPMVMRVDSTSRPPRANSPAAMSPTF